MPDNPTEHGYCPPEPDPFVLMWDELLQMPRVLWACWYDMLVDTMVGLLPRPAAWPGEAAR